MNRSSVRCSTLKVCSTVKARCPRPHRPFYFAFPITDDWPLVIHPTARSASRTSTRCSNDQIWSRLVLQWALQLHSVARRQLDMVTLTSRSDPFSFVGEQAAYSEIADGTLTASRSWPDHMDRDLLCIALQAVSGPSTPGAALRIVLCSPSKRSLPG